MDANASVSIKLPPFLVLRRLFSLGRVSTEALPPANSSHSEAMLRISTSVSLPPKAAAFRPSIPASSSLFSKRFAFLSLGYFGMFRRKIVATGSVASADSLVVKLPSHPTYDLKAVIALALAEDAGDRGDVTSLATLPSEMEVEAHFIAKEDGVIAGIALAEMIFDQVDPSLKVEWSVRDGNYINKGMQFGKVYGCAHNIVVSERVVLNFMQRMSGIATFTKAMADAAYPAYILETRKTAPGLRLVDKWAVLIGGGKNHRMGLFDMVMIKDNHISIAGGVANAMKSVDSFLEKKNLNMPVEVETRTLEEVKEVLNYASQTRCSLTRIMLDNMVIPLPNGDVDVTMLKEAVEMIDSRFETEASGNVSLETVKKIGETGVTYISSGALTHSVKALDISLKIDTDLALQVARRTNRA